MSETKEKKGNKRIVIISIVILLVIALASVGGYFMYKQIDLNAPLQEDWANIYYNYIKESKQDGERKNIQNNSKIGFIDVEELENPVMTVEYEKDDDKYTDIYYIDNGEVQHIENTISLNLIYLYNIEIQKYGWYLHNETGLDDTYIRILEQILKNNLEASQEEENIDITEYKFEKGEEISTDTIDGNKISIPKYDTVFVDTDIELETVDYTEEMTDRELKDAIIKGTSEYKDEEEILTDELKEKVTNKENETNEKQEEIKQAEEAVKKAEAMKITQSNVISKIGEHLKYFTGCYRGSIYGIYEIFKLNNVNVSVPGVDPNYEMTYEVVGLKSISSLNSTINKYIKSDVVSRLKSRSGDITKYLHDYSGKVYFAIGGVGDSSYIKYQNAKVISSEGDTSVVQLQEFNAFTDSLENRINVTVKYDEATSSYIITDYTVN